MNYSKMTNEELIKAAREGDEYAENLLMKNNMGLISELENKLANKGIDRIELFSAGQLGLVRAYKSYNIKNETKAKFHTYAYPVIRNEMLKLFEHESRDKRKGKAMSLNTPLHMNTENEITIEETLKAESTNFDLIVMINAAISKFNKKSTEQQREIFKLSVFQGLSNADIGKRMNVSKQYVWCLLDRIRKDHFSQLIEI